jgi:hypothetical protein
MSNNIDAKNISNLNTSTRRAKAIDLLNRKHVKTIESRLEEISGRLDSLQHALAVHRGDVSHIVSTLAGIEALLRGGLS